MAVDLSAPSPTAEATHSPVATAHEAHTLRSAADYYRRQRRLNLLAIRAARRAKARGVQAVAEQIGGYQTASAALAETAATAMLTEQGIAAEAVGTLNPSNFVTDKKVLTDLIRSTATDEAFDRLVSSLVNDAGRTGMGVTSVARPAVTGHVRYLNPPSCARCAILAGRFYKYSKGFQRHPKCDCQMIPSDEVAAQGLVSDPMEAFKNGQIKDLTKRETRALTDGADMNQLVNIRRHAAELKRGGSVITRGGRMTPEGIYRLAHGRDEAVELLVKYGYIKPGSPAARAAAAARLTDDLQPLSRHLFSDPNTPRTREIDLDEYQRLYDKGAQQYAAFQHNATPPTGLDNNWSRLKDDAYKLTRDPWGGMTVDAHTGVKIPAGANKYAITAKTPGMHTVSIPWDATEAEFFAAMDAARERFGVLLANQNFHLGVFRDDAIRRIDFDPVLVVTSHADVESLGVFTHALGGAFNFADGLGYWPPYLRAADRAAYARWMTAKRATARQAVDPKLMTGDALDHELAALMNAGDYGPRSSQLMVEMDRRDGLMKATTDLKMTGKQLDDRLAYTELMERERLAHIAWQKERAAAKTQRITAAQREKVLRDEYDTWTHSQWLRAEEMTRGNLLSKEGTRAFQRGEFDVMDLFTRRRRSLEYASDELKEWFAHNPRMTYPEFRASIMDDKAARKAQARLRNRGWESEFG